MSADRLQCPIWREPRNQTYERAIPRLAGPRAYPYLGEFRVLQARLFSKEENSDWPLSGLAR